MTEIVDLTEQIATLEASLEGAMSVTSVFDGELSRLRDSLVFTSQEVGALSAGFSGGLKQAFNGVVFDGMRLTDALKGLARSMADTVFNTAMKPIHGAVGGLLAEGLNSVLGNVMPFAKGGVVTQPTNFPMGGGMGLMGEAGPEAIMPLTRGPDGRLGIATRGAARPVTVVMNISTPDVQSFQRSQSQIAAQALRALSQGQRNR